MPLTSYTFNPAEIGQHINACAAHDATARHHIRAADYRAVINSDGLLVSSSKTEGKSRSHENKFLLVQAWPGGDAMTLVAYRLLGAALAPMPSELSTFEFAIDWSAEVGIKQAYPIIVHVVQGADIDAARLEFEAILHREITYNRVTMVPGAPGLGKTTTVMKLLPATVRHDRDALLPRHAGGPSYDRHIINAMQPAVACGSYPQP